MRTGTMTKTEKFTHTMGGPWQHRIHSFRSLTWVLGAPITLYKSASYEYRRTAVFARPSTYKSYIDSQMLRRYLCNIKMVLGPLTRDPWRSGGAVDMGFFRTPIPRGGWGPIMNIHSLGQSVLRHYCFTYISRSDTPTALQGKIVSAMWCPFNKGLLHCYNVIRFWGCLISTDFTDFK